ncbi:MAG: hypothetical protein ACJ8NR_12850 [Sulfurifustis sp.]
MTTFARLSAAAYSVGKTLPVSALQQSENVAPGVIAELEKRGLRYFCDDDRTIAEMCLASASQTLERARLRPDQIDAIVVGPSFARWDLDEEFALLSALHRAGFQKTRIIGLSLQACGVLGSALKVAGDLVTQEQGGRKNVLLIVFGRHFEGSRLAPQATVLFSDGAASCIVSSDSGEFEILAAESLTDPFLTTMQWTDANFPRYLQAGIVALKEVTSRVYRQTQVSAKEITAVFGTNGSHMYLDMIGLASGISGSKVYKGALPKYAHVFGCDNLIGLRDLSDETKLSNGQYFLLVSWAPYVVGAAMLRYVGN